MKKVDYSVKTPLHQIPYNEEYGIYILTENVTDYSEGEKSENYLYKTLNESDDNSVFSIYLHGAIKDWSSEYHFSSLRSNILRPLNITQDMDILEIGGGCGSITRYLGETGANIISVEGAFNRAKCIRKRCKELENVKVICSNIESVEFDKKFDIVTLIGVFEYTPKYSNQENPFHAALQQYKQLIKPSGVLVIAIENKMGLKYFAGFNEDHYGNPYVGIEDRYVEGNVRTFGKLEIEKLLNNNGFGYVDFLYPFPDYKLPKVILTQRGIEADEFNISDLIRTGETRHYNQKPKSSLMNHDLVWKSLEENKMVGDMSNSFLIIAKQSESSTEFVKDVLAQHYTCDRYPNLNTKVDFIESANGIVIQKTVIRSSKSSNYKPTLVDHNIDETPTPYIYGDNLHNLIMNCIYSNDLNGFKKYLKSWINYLKTNAIQELNAENIGLSLINLDYYDSLPVNIICDKFGKLHNFDREWVFNNPITLNGVILRYLKRFRGIPSLYFPEFYFFRSFVNQILKENGLVPMSKSLWKSSQRFENDFLNEINLPQTTSPFLYKRSFVLLVLKMLRDFKTFLFTKQFAGR